MNESQKKIFDQYNAAGWSAFYYPKLKKISLNGFPRISVSDAILKMKAALKSKNLI